MRKSLFYMLIGLGLFFFGWLFSLTQNVQNYVADPDVELLTSNIDESKPWIEIGLGKMYRVSASSTSEVRELRTGDYVVSGDVLETTSDGSANINFPDGSVVRLSENTKLALEVLEFKRVENLLNIQFVLLSGKAWSKVIPFLNKKSNWVAVTDNVKVSAIGTAFGVSKSNDATLIVCSEGKLGVRILDPSSAKILTREPVLVGPGEYLQIDDQTIRKINSTKTTTAFVSPKNLTRSMKEDSWIASSKKRDGEINSAQEKLNSSYSVPRSASLEIMTATASQILEKSATTTALSADKQSIATTTYLRVFTTTSLGSVVEGDTLQFSAVYGTRDVSRDVMWVLNGPIGTITVDGLFSAELSAEVSELGRSEGYVSAIYTDSVTGQKIFGQSIKFNVIDKVDPSQIDLRG